MKNKTLIVGVGNLLRRDDGVGPTIIKLLQQKKDPSFVLIDGGTDGLALLDQIAEYEEAIIIDAVQMAAPPGTVRSFTPAEAKIHIKNDVLSTHGFGLADMLKFVEKLAIKTKISIIGVQPKDINFGEGLSNEVQTKIPLILDLIQQITI